MLVRMTTSARAARSTILGILVVLALLGVGWDVMTFLESQRPHTGGDGLGMFFPAIGVLLFLPVQLLALVAVAYEVWTRSRTARAPVDAEERAVDPTHARVVAWVAAAMLGGPALVMLGVLVVHALLPDPSYALHDALFMLAEPMTLVWGPTWALGMVVAGVAFGRYDRPLPLLLAPLYPLLGAAYMFS